MTAEIYAVVGAGGCGRGILPLLRAQLQQHAKPSPALVFVDDGVKEGLINGQRCLTTREFLAEPGKKHAVIGVANSNHRRRIAAELQSAGVSFVQAKAENCVVFDDVKIGEGACLSPFVTITCNVRIGAHFHANLYSYVEHDCRIGDFVTFAPGVQCNGNVLIEDNAYIGAGALIKQGKPGAPLTIGAGAVVGMGAVVTRSVPAGATVVGNPARIMRRT